MAEVPAPSELHSERRGARRETGAPRVESSPGASAGLDAQRVARTAASSANPSAATSRLARRTTCSPGTVRRSTPRGSYLATPARAPRRTERVRGQTAGTRWDEQHAWRVLALKADDAEAGKEESCSQRIPTQDRGFRRNPATPPESAPTAACQGRWAIGPRRRDHRPEEVASEPSNAPLGVFQRASMCFDALRRGSSAGLGGGHHRRESSENRVCDWCRSLFGGILCRCEAFASRRSAHFSVSEPS